MNKVQIFVEGIADQKFLQDLILEWYNIELTIGDVGKPGELISLGGKDAFSSPDKMKRLIPLFQQLQIQGIPIIVIFDADLFVENHNALYEYSQVYNFKFFLLPNNVDDGDLETLLENIICEKNKIIFDCWEEFENCLKRYNTDSTLSGKFTTPAKKTKIYAYLETLLGDSDSEKNRIKERLRDYRNPNHWNLSPSHHSLTNLKAFLDLYF